MSDTRHPASDRRRPLGWRTSSQSGAQGDCVEVSVQYADGQDA